MRTTLAGRTAATLVAGLLSLAVPRADAPTIRFTDVTQASGVRFQHVTGGSGRYYFAEQWGSGAAFFDYDNDGLLDLFLAQGGALPGFKGRPAGNRLFRNLGNGTFTDVTSAAGLVSTRYTFGVAAADYDNDGDTDLFITALQGDVLYRNDRGRFTDVSARAGIKGRPLATSAAFFDYDNDGRLDLFVARYLDYNLETDRGCEVPDYGLGPPRAKPLITFCGPSANGVASQLYRNEGDGVFKDVSALTGVSRSVARGLGVAVADFDEDGLQDVFVASDRLPNLLLMNQGGKRFDERGLAAGVAVGPDALAFAGMGVDAADYDNDGKIDVVVTNYENEPSSLYRNTGGGTFEDESRRSRLSQLVWGFLKWGCRLLDFDGDGLKDFFTVNGHIYRDVDLVTPPGLPLPGTVRKGYAQEAQILRQQPAGRFVDVSASAGPFFARTHVSRGAAFGDYDNDGDYDALVTNLDGPAVLLRNDSAVRRWARLHLEGDGCNRSGIGAVVRAAAGGVTQTMTVQSGGSYLSDHDLRPLFGLPGTGHGAAEIRWPCGAVQRVTLADRTTQVVRESACRRRSAGAPAR